MKYSNCIADLYTETCIMKTFIAILLIGGLSYAASGEKAQDRNEGRATANNKEDEPMGHENVTSYGAGLGDQPGKNEKITIHVH